MYFVISRNLEHLSTLSCAFLHVYQQQFPRMFQKQELSHSVKCAEYCESESKNIWKTSLQRLHVGKIPTESWSYLVKRVFFVLWARRKGERNIPQQLQIACNFWFGRTLYYSSGFDVFLVEALKWKRVKWLKDLNRGLELESFEVIQNRLLMISTGKLLMFWRDEKKLTGFKVEFEKFE